MADCSRVAIGFRRRNRATLFFAVGTSRLTRPVWTGTLARRRAVRKTIRWDGRREGVPKRDFRNSPDRFTMRLQTQQATFRQRLACVAALV